jgi:hypothetical protein
MPHLLFNPVNPVNPVKIQFFDCPVPAKAAARQLLRGARAARFSGPLLCCSDFSPAALGFPPKASLPEKARRDEIL